MNIYPFYKCFVGGTFDGMHIGHQSVITRACREAEQVIIGVTTDDFIKQTKSGVVTKPFEERNQQLTTWIRSQGLQDKVTSIAISDRYEPVVSDQSFDAIIVTRDNKKTGEEINRKRQEKGLSPLVLIEEPLVLSDDGKPVSSTRMRKGEIDASGHLVLPDHVRPLLKEPLGTVITGESMYESVRLHKDSAIVAVGDKTAQTCLEAGVVPGISIIDLFVQRKPYPTMNYFNAIADIQMMSVKSGPGYISDHAQSAIKSWKPGDKKRLIVVDGEEDLLVLPVVVYMPVGTIVYYGQPNIGLVEVIITEETKKKARELLAQFTS